MGFISDSTKSWLGKHEHPKFMLHSHRETNWRQILRFKIWQLIGWFSERFIPPDLSASFSCVEVNGVIVLLNICLEVWVMGIQ